MGLTLSTLPKHLRQIALWLVITLTIGYTTGLVFVYHTTSLTPKGAQERYRGNQPAEGAAPAPMAEEPVGGGEEEMKFEKSFAEMLNITHTHILAMASFFAFAAGIFSFSSKVRGRLKSFLIVEPFVAIVVSFSCLWLMRYVHPKFSYLLMLSSGTMALCFYIMMIVSFLELIARPAAAKPELRVYD
jgi:hypothetical protein